MTVTYLAGAIDDNDTAFAVAGVAGFPSTGSFDVVIDSERMTVGAGAGTTSWSSVTRGIQGTTAASHLDGAAVYFVPTAYATLDRLLTLYETVPTNARKLARLGDLLGVATGQVIDEADGRDYFKHPTTGTAAWTADGDGGDVLHLHYGLVSLSLLELSYDGGLSYVSSAATDYMLLGDNPYSHEPLPDGEPYFHIRFTGYGGYRYFPATVRAARLTGVRGWSAIPEPLVEATAQRARQLATASSGYSGSDAGGPDEYGHMAPTDRFWPQALYNFLQNERSRFRPCVLGGRAAAPWSGRR